jgi:glycerate-2-kinase
MSGGGSALMPLPADGVTLEQKLAVTRFLSASGATINEINTVRKQLSGIKGGALKRFCQGTKLVGLILSDVLGDPLDIIASGPTVDNTTTADDAIQVLEKYGFGYQALGFRLPERGSSVISEDRNPRSEVLNLVIGNNATAVDAAGLEAVHRGYSPTMLCATQSEGDVETLAEHFVDVIRKVNDLTAARRSAADLSDCFISGGEPTVKLVTESQRGLGGRNQQLVLAVICRLFSDATWLAAVRENPDICRFAFLSGGTDGEDGPTDAAGAFFDGHILHHIAQSGIDPNDYLKRNDAYHFFEQFDALVKTGLTGTNVCDIRVFLRS